MTHCVTSLMQRVIMSMTLGSFFPGSKVTLRPRRRVVDCVAAIFPPMWPDLPMPVTTTRPSVARQSRQAASQKWARRPVGTFCRWIKVVEVTYLGI